MKPEFSGAEIVSCAVCWNGKRSISYPWAKEAIVATAELCFNSDFPKVGWNIKFEDRWFRYFLKNSVQGWLFDGMLSTHILDNRKGITGLKFQAFAELGIEPYEHVVKPYLQSDDKNHLNRIRELDLPTLLKYGGYDALYEYVICKRQVKQMKDKSET